MNQVLAGSGIHYKGPRVQQQSSTMLLIKQPDLRRAKLWPGQFSSSPLLTYMTRQRLQIV
jgi:hypothetical protein